MHKFKKEDIAKRMSRLSIHPSFLELMQSFQRYREKAFRRTPIYTLEMYQQHCHEINLVIKALMAGGTKENFISQLDSITKPHPYEFLIGGLEGVEACLRWAAYAPDQIKAEMLRLEVFGKILEQFTPTNGDPKPRVGYALLLLQPQLICIPSATIMLYLPRSLRAWVLGNDEKMVFRRWSEETSREYFKYVTNAISQTHAAEGSHAARMLLE